MKTNDPFEMELTADLIVRAYKAGIFPMAEDASSPDLFWVSPEERGIIPLDKFHISRTLRKAIKNNTYTIRIDHDFDAVIEGCASSGSDRDSTWINNSIVKLYRELFDRGICHTVEVWDGEKLVGGLYGLSIGAAFFGESMFHRVTNGSKIALTCLVARLRVGNYLLLDTQFLTDHLRSLGGIEISREVYEPLLADALTHTADFHGLAGGGTSLDCLQLVSQMS